MVKEKMLNGHNEDVSPQIVQLVVDEPEIGLVQCAIPSGLGEFTPGGPQTFV